MILLCYDETCGNNLELLADLAIELKGEVFVGRLQCDGTNYCAKINKDSNNKVIGYEEGKSREDFSGVVYKGDYVKNSLKTFGLNLLKKDKEKPKEEKK